MARAVDLSFADDARSMMGWRKGRQMGGPIRGVEYREVGVALGDGDEEVDEELRFELVAK